MDSPVRYRFDEFELDVAERTLARGTEALTLQPKTFDLLVYLVTHPRTLLTKQVLLDALWGEVVVTENSLTRCVHQLRSALGDEADEPRYIETVPRVGYRFLATVEPISVAATSARLPGRRVHTKVAVVTTGVAVLLLAAIVWFRGERVADEPPAIAVLPFVNMSGDSENEFFTDGISAEILDRLAANDDLRVIARTSSFAFKGSGYDVKKLSSLLDVSYVLEGSVRKDGQLLRISTQLVDASGQHVWNKSYDREEGSIFATQREIADAVVESIAPHVNRRTTTPRQTPQPEAYREYLIGREMLKKRLPRAQERAMVHLDRAVAIDPAFAEAHIERAFAAFYLYDQGDRQTTVAAARKSLDTGLALDPNLPRAYEVQALFLREADDLEGEEAALRKAIALDASSVDARNWLHRLLKVQGRDDEALEQLESAQRIDPLAGAIATNLAIFDAERGDLASAERRLATALEVPQPAIYVRKTLVDLLTLSGRLAEATAVARDHVLDHARQTGREGVHWVLAECYARLGMWEHAEHWWTRGDTPPREQDTVWDVQLPILNRRAQYEDALAQLEGAFLTSGRQWSELAREEQWDYGKQLALAGRYADAVHVLEQSAPARGWVEAAEHSIDAALTLVWARQRLTSTRVADDVVTTIERWYADHERRGSLHLSVDRLLFARTALLAGDRALALDRLRGAVDAGWRDYYLLQGDPRWDDVREAPEFQALLARIKVDVDKERAEVERVEQTLDLDAQLDALLTVRG